MIPAVMTPIKRKDSMDSQENICKDLLGGEVQAHLLPMEEGCVCGELAEG